MGRKRPAGARRRGPSTRRGRFDPFGDDPEAVMYRMFNAEPVVVCFEESVWDVMDEAHRWLEGHADALPHGDYALVLGSDEAPWVRVLAFGLGPRLLGELHVALLAHPNADGWGVAEPMP